MLPSVKKYYTTVALDQSLYVTVFTAAESILVDNCSLYVFMLEGITVLAEIVVQYQVVLITYKQHSF